MESLETDLEQIDLNKLQEYCIQYEKKVVHDCFDHLKIVKKQNLIKMDLRVLFIFGNVRYVVVKNSSCLKK